MYPGNYINHSIPKNTIGWKSLLKSMNLSLTWDTRNHEEFLKEATEMMQNLYPGQYKIEEYYNARLKHLDLRLVFDDPKEETLWMLKYG